METNVFNSMENTYAYGLNHQARALESVYNDPNNITENEISKFVVGTCDLDSTNEVHLIGYNSVTNNITNIIYKHPEQVLSLSPCPKDTSLIFTCHMNSNLEQMSYGCTLWKMPDVELLNNEGEDGKISRSLVPIATMKKDSKDPIKKILWDYNVNNNQLFSINKYSINLWSLSNDMSKCIFKHEIHSLLDQSNNETSQINCGEWHNEEQTFFLGYQDNLVGIDSKSNKINHQLKTDHCQLNCLNLNKKLNHQFVTGGIDGKVKLWDLRNLKNCLKIYEEHTHWVWSLQINENYDELILSGGSDGRILLYSNPNLSSVNVFNDNEQQRIDKVVASYEQHEDSVYSIKWSKSNPWLFASLSYDGQLMLHNVPDQEKYRILL
ncbi:WD40 repeat-like protein [Neoconidiobolus thromboides FSU 785]|nr:WD40 repeat-like protein [Neoconidiobolus thromboides FSU 785]